MPKNTKMPCMAAFGQNSSINDVFVTEQMSLCSMVYESSIVFADVKEAVA